MWRDDQIRIHAARADAELNRSRAATSRGAAEAHLALSELHLARMRVLDEATYTRPVLKLVTPKPAAVSFDLPARTSPLPAVTRRNSAAG